MYINKCVEKFIYIFVRINDARARTHSTNSKYNIFGPRLFQKLYIKKKKMYIYFDVTRTRTYEKFNRIICSACAKNA